MGVFSGKYGVVDGYDTVRNWVLNETTTPAEFRASNTKAGTGRREGIYDYSGSFEGYAGVPPVMPGDYFNFTGFTAPTTGARGTAGTTKSVVNAIVESVSINWNWENGELLNWSLDFASGEPLIITEGTASTVDAVAPNPPIICGTKVTLTGSDTTWPNIVSATLNITANNPTFVNSSTAGKTGRRPGIIDWTANIVEQSASEFTSLVASTCLGSKVGGTNILRLWTSSSLYWDLTYAHYVSAEDFRVDIDSGDIIQQTHNFAMSAESQGSLGYIGRPGEDGGSNPWWWPDTYNADTLPF